MGRKKPYRIGISGWVTYEPPRATKRQEPKCPKTKDGVHVWDLMDKKEILDIADDMLAEQGSHTPLKMPVENIFSCKFCGIMKLVAKKVSEESS